MSVTELSRVDPRELIGTGRVDLLTATGTYDVERYGWAYEFWKRQQQTHWMGEEVPLGADIKDWSSERVTDNERALLTQIFRFFTQSDVEVGDNYLKRYIPIFQPLEVQMMMAAFSNMETVHFDFSRPKRRELLHERRELLHENCRHRRRLFALTRPPSPPSRPTSARRSTKP